MTNGEKLIRDFPYIKIKGQDEVFTAIQIDTTGTGTPIIVYTEWWNSEYKEPTTKNDLGVDAISRKQAIDAFPNLLPNMGYNKKAITEILQEVPSVTPQESISETDIILTREEYGELVSSEYDNGYAKGYREALEQEPFINKPCVSSGVCEHDKNEVLNKIRAEIIKYEGDCRLSDDEYPSCKQCTDNVFETIYGILDKYKADTEKT